MHGQKTGVTVEEPRAWIMEMYYLLITFTGQRDVGKKHSNARPVSCNHVINIPNPKTESHRDYAPMLPIRECYGLDLSLADIFAFMLSRNSFQLKYLSERM